MYIEPEKISCWVLTTLMLCI